MTTWTDTQKDDRTGFSLVRCLKLGREGFFLYQKSVTELLNGPDGTSIAQWPMGQLSCRYRMSEPDYIFLI